MKKKILSLVLALLMASSSAAFVAADDTAAVVDETPVVTATEEEEESPYAYAVEFLHHYKIYKGVSASDLATEEDIQRYQMALFVARISTGWVEDEKWEDGDNNYSNFTDIDEGDAAKRKGAIAYANMKGIIEGYGNGKFGPYDGITYQDALTMVVRTLGHQGLDWPWGYIERAIELGLTEGITDVAYTDILTRGEVAQIIYNAMFAPTKTGSTLALDHFGIEFGWEPIVITASDLATYEKNGAFSGTKQDNEDQKIIAFKLYNDDGSVDTGKDAVTYYTKAASLGFDADKHQDELAVGTTMWVFFEKDSNSNLVNIIDYRVNTVDTIWNMGKTDDEAVDQDYAIKEYLKGYSLVSKYTPVNYVSHIDDKKLTKKLNPEIIVYNALADLTIETLDGVKYGDNLAIDWTTGDILVPCKESEAAYTVEDGDVKTYYKVAWYFNEAHDMYFRYKYSKDNVIVGIEWLTDSKLEETYKAAYEASKKTVHVPGFNEPQTSNVGESAYASLTLEDVDLDGVAERGIYEEYGIGYFSVTTKKCKDCNKEYPAYRVQKATTEFSKENVTGVTGTKWDDDCYEFIEKPCGHYTYKDTAWFAEGYEPSKDEDGAYENGYVIYSYDKTTHEIKIVKELGTAKNPLGNDIDSYVATGVLRAYSPDKQSVTIGGNKFETAYHALKNTGFYKTNDNANKGKYAEALDSMFNEFVQYVVVDNEVVAMNLVGTTKENYLVIKDYAGMTNDNYIAVDAYSTKTQTLGTYCIASYDGWKQGDFNYATINKINEAFKPGTIYFIKSYDDVNDLYYVELVGEHSNFNYEVEDLECDEKVTLKFASDGYVEVHQKQSDGKDKVINELKMKNEDTYIIIPKQTITNTDYAPMYVYTGKVSEVDWTVEGDRVKGLGDRVFVIVNAENVKGFNLDRYQSGMVLYQGGKTISAGYDEAMMGEGNVSSIVKERYLVGASVTTVEVVDLYSGKDATVTDRNIDLKKDHVYVTVSGQVREPWLQSGSEETALKNVSQFIQMMKNTYYADNNVDKYAESANYLFGYDIMVDMNKDTKEDAIKAALVKAVNDDLGSKDKYQHVRSRVDTNNFTYYVAEFGTDGNTMKLSNKNAFAGFLAKTDITAVEIGYVYNVANGTTAVYAMKANTETVTEKQTETLTIVKDVEGIKGVNIDQTITYDVTKLNGKITKIVVTGVKFEYTGTDNMQHIEIAKKGLAFGHESDHFGGSIITGANNGLFDADAAGTIYTVDQGAWGSVDLYKNANSKNVVYTTYDCKNENGLCDLVKAIEFKGLSAVAYDWETYQDSIVAHDEAVAEGKADVPAIRSDLLDAFFVLKLHIMSNDNELVEKVETYDAEWSIGSNVTVNDPVKREKVVMTLTDDTAPSGVSYEAINPDAIQDVVTAPVEITVDGADATVD